MQTEKVFLDQIAAGGLGEPTVALGQLTRENRTTAPCRKPTL
jgi:hypothetical protein